VKRSIKDIPAEAFLDLKTAVPPDKSSYSMGLNTNLSD
jgi:hypothetical protein